MRLLLTLSRLVFAALLTLFASTLSASPLTISTPDTVGMSAEQLKRIDAVMQKAIAKGDTPGAVVLVARQGKIVFRKAYGHKALKPVPEPMKVDTIFDVASLTKVMATATAIMLLVEDGKLALTDRVADHLPKFAQNGKKDITIEQLMTHYSGLAPDLDLVQTWQGYETAVNKAYAEKCQAKPGEKFIYSDINYLVAAELVRKLSGKSLNEFTALQIYQPLEMQDTAFNPDKHLQPRIAPTEKRLGQWLRGVVHDPSCYRMGGVAGHAGLFSTVDDTAIFAQMILDGGQYHGIRILHPKTVNAMIQNHAPLGKNEKRGIGFDLTSHYATTRGDLLAASSFGHTGYTGTSLWIDPETQTIIILFTNRVHPDGKGDVVRLRKYLANVVASSIV